MENAILQRVEKQNMKANAKTTISQHFYDLFYKEKMKKEAT